MLNSICSVFPNYLNLISESSRIFKRNFSYTQTRYPTFEKKLLMKKIFLLILIISSNIFGQKKVGNDVFKMEFLRISDNIQGDQNNYYSDLVERSMFSKKDSLNYGFLNSKGKNSYRSEIHLRF